ncbi:MAG TPA: hypothetical protein VII92_02635 [Anaerolineae bacterium]
MLTTGEIAKRLGRTPTAREIAQQHADGRANDLTHEQIVARIPVLRQQLPGLEEIKEYHSHFNTDGTRKRETRTQAFKRLEGELNARVESQQAQKDLQADPTYQKVNAMASRIYDDVAWDVSVPQSQLLLAQDMREAAQAGDYKRFSELNKEWVKYRQQSVTDRQSVVDAEIVALQAKRESIAGDEYQPDAPLPAKESYSHIRRTSGKMQFIDRRDGHIVEYDPLVPFAKEQALQQLGEHQRAIESVTAS